MHAGRLHAAGDPATLAFEQIDTPHPGPGELLVRVHAAAIARDPGSPTSHSSWLLRGELLAGQNRSRP